MKFKSVVFEGGDQVGKADAAQVFCSYLLEKNTSINRLSFPIYATPIGSVIRMFLKNGIEGIKKLDNIKGTQRELEIRMMIYALNRLEALESILRRPKIYSGIFLLDRSPYSNALTIAYGLGGLKSIKKGNVSELVRLGFEIESLMIKILGLTNCVIHLKVDSGKKGWEASRLEDADFYESKDVQDVADYVYSEYAKLVGKGWNMVYTKKDSRWRDRGVIYKEIRDVVDSRFELKSSNKGVMKTIDVIDIAKDIYGLDISNLEGVDKYYKAIKGCNKAVIYKEALKISKHILESNDGVLFKNNEILNHVRNILEEYPECFDLLEYYLDKSFVNKLRIRIFE